MSDKPDQNKMTLSWWDRPITVTRGQLVIGAVTWAVLDFIEVLWRHL